MSYPKMKLGECAEIHSGSTPRTNNPDFWDGDITWVTPKDLSKLKSKFISKTESKITQLGFNSCSTKLLPKNSVLFSSRAPIGHVAINTIPMCTNQGFKSFVPKADLLDSQYLYYWLKANKEYLQDLGVGATFKEISKTVIANVEIPLPPLAEQRRIASILDQADVLRQKRQQTIEKLDQLLQATFIDMFGDPVSNPKGWDKEKMDTLMTIVRGGSPRPIENFLGGTYPWIKIGDATKGDDLFITKTKEAITEEGLHKTRLLPEGSVIFANCGVSLGFARILKIQGCIHDGWLAFQDIREDKIHKLFLLKALNSITQYFRDTAPDGTQPNLNTAIMKNFELIIPPMDLQLKFIAIVESIVKQKKILETSNIEFSNLFKSLQNQAFNGTL
ncbi:restriction endonuclease subunit S [Acinetobacter sp. BIGb0102]|uniref:restriction endonuclease subunit S n=1 Tax=Acinetobacter sp. BIGb0102 TaxID=2485131 RepID=UPI000F4DF8A1|nr:restriction endonuclease subunit S [Acinetobacter sp. BIGb0102]